MPLPDDYPTAADELRRLLRDTDKPLKVIAHEAGVPYVPLWKWVNGKQKSYNLLQSELVYHYLTGRTFIRRK